MEHALLTPGFNTDFIFGFLMIVLVDIVLSGDNSIVIALAVQGLAPEKRSKGILFGAAAAAGLRILFTTLASRLMQVPYLKLVGGILILWIAIKLLVENSEADSKGKDARSIWHAVWMIVVADFTMSLDNVLAVAGASKGNGILLWFGLGLSIPLVVFGSTLLAKLMSRYPMIITIGAAILGKVGADMILGDPLMKPHLVAFHWIHIIGPLVGIAVVLLTSTWLKRRHASAFPVPSEE